ncbi:HXXEE domain-containing protein [Paenibacillus thermotolerans]|uniref:HXXEE domain-containing protein n=1 Tax=Paenibacillus thermotolerans TaxID=3027807 RepID=UPI002367A266|nr:MULTISPECIES: HXXEE domain-containing protein [unclassified Paenibacillus]
MMLEIHNAIWLFVVIFMLHDFEEIISVEHWAKKTESSIKSDGGKLAKKIWNFWNVNSNTFAKRDVMIFSIMSAIIFLKVQFVESNWSAILFICFLAFVLIHNAVHMVQTLILRKYTPGLYTAILTVTPYSIYLFYRLA